MRYNAAHTTNFTIMKTWIDVSIEGVKYEPIVIKENDAFLSKSNMLMKSYNLHEKKVRNICVSIKEGTDSCNTTIYEKNICFAESGITSVLNSLLFRVLTPSTNVDFTLVHKKDGGIICTIACGSKSESFIIPTKDSNNKTKSEMNIRYQSNNEHPYFTASECFIANLGCFKDLLEPLYESISNNDSAIQKKWSEAIENCPNSSLIQAEFKKCNGNMNLWLNTLLSWGIKRDKCKKYILSVVNPDNYDIEGLHRSNDEDEILNVVVPCWTIVKKQSGKNVETNLIKGKLSFQ